MRSILFGLLAGLFLFPASAHAGFTVIYYSEPERTYGWFAGSSQRRGHSGAQSNCIKQGGTACKPIVECGGWGAVAYAWKPVQGFGAACGADALTARRIALTACMAASKTLCWTEVTFRPQGKALSDADDLNFDRAWFSQIALQVRNLYKGNKNGVAGPDTVAAVSAFQEKIGRPATGVIDNELVFRLMDAVGGAQNFAFMMERDVLPSIKDAIAEVAPKTDQMYSHSSAPAKQPGTSEDFNSRSDEARRMALATYLSARGSKCTLPAKDARLVAGFWLIECKEGDYTLIMTAGSTVITKTGKK